MPTIHDDIEEPGRRKGRDNFKASTVKRLAMRANYICSNPHCCRTTAGPKSDNPDEAIVVGIAAHITAAAEGGPRYDETLTAVDRSATANGIWLCSNCARLIDVDPIEYPVSRLLKWKRDHEQRMSQSLMGRVAANDQANLTALAQTSTLPVSTLESIIQPPASPTQDLTITIEGTYRLFRDEVGVILDIVNASTTDFTINTLELSITGVSREPSTLSSHFRDRWNTWAEAQLPLTVSSGGMHRVAFAFRSVSTSFGPEAIDQLQSTTTGLPGHLAINAADYPATIHSTTSRTLIAAGKKLRPLTQWICDTCRLPILSPKDGWLEYDNISPTRPYTYGHFRVVHHRMASPKASGCYGMRDLYTAHLHHVIEEGPIWAILHLEGPFFIPERAQSNEEPSPLRADVTDLSELFRRLWLPFYEQARHHLRQALADDFTDQDSLSGLPISLLERVVDRYASEEYTPEILLE